MKQTTTFFAIICVAETANKQERKFSDLENANHAELILEGDKKLRSVTNLGSQRDVTSRGGRRLESNKTRQDQ